MRIRTHIIAALVSIVAITSACEAGGPGEELAPRSLEDTEFDGRFTIEAGRFVFDEQAQRAFDYLLTASDELPPAVLDRWVAGQVRMALSPDELAVHGQIMAAWRRYVAFRAEAVELLSPVAEGEAPDLAAIEQGLLAAVDAHLGEAPIAVTERLRIEQGLAIHQAYQIADVELRQAKLGELSELEAQRFADSSAGRYLAGRQAVAEAEAAGADAGTIAALRAEHFEAISPGAVERLAALDARRAAWAERVAAYEAERADLELALADSPAQLEQELAALREASFSPAEQRRLAAFAQR